MEHTQTFKIKKARKGKGKAANIISLSSFKDNRLFDRVFIISDLFTAGVVDSKAERNYQNTIKDI